MCHEPAYAAHAHQEPNINRTPFELITPSGLKPEENPAH
jgi:hypothetical protein